MIVAEPSPRGTRIVALTTGMLGLIAVGSLMVAITPDPTGSPIALISSTSPAAGSPGIGSPGIGSPGIGSPGIGSQAIGRAASLAPAATDRVGLRSEVEDVLATPIGDGRFALVTRSSLSGSDQNIIDVRLPSGRMSAGSIVTAAGDTVVVALMNVEPGHLIARDRPGPADLVTVMATPPIVVAFDDVDTLVVDEGTAVIDDDGELVGICSRRHDSDHVRLIEVGAELADATSVVP